MRAEAGVLAADTHPEFAVALVLRSLHDQCWRPSRGARRRHYGRLHGHILLLPVYTRRRVRGVRILSHRLQRDHATNGRIHMPRSISCGILIVVLSVHFRTAVLSAAQDPPASKPDAGNPHLWAPRTKSVAVFKN